jgi:hypothetical protein
MRTIAIGLLALALGNVSVTAQTADEQARILVDFQQSVAIRDSQGGCVCVFEQCLNTVHGENIRVANRPS